MLADRPQRITIICLAIVDFEPTHVLSIKILPLDSMRAVSKLEKAGRVIDGDRHAAHRI